MLSTTSLLCALPLAAFAYGYPGMFEAHWVQHLNLIECNRITLAISRASGVFYLRVSREFAHP